MPLESRDRPRFDRTGILIGGRRFEEWTDYSIDTDIFTPSNRFALRCGPLNSTILKEILPGHEISIYFGNDEEDHIILTGWIEGFNCDTGKEDITVEIAGRDLASDLLENSVPQGLAVKGKTFYDLAETICDPFSIPVLATNEANRLSVVDKKKYKQLMAAYAASQLPYNANVIAFQKLLAGTFESVDVKDKQFKSILTANGIVPTLQPPRVSGIFKTLDEAEPQDGESCWDFLVRYAEKLEVHMWMSAGGMLVIQRPRYDQDPLYTFIISESNPSLTNCRMRYGVDIGGMPTRLTRTGKYVGKGEKRDRLETVYDSTKLIPSSDPNLIIPEGSLRVASDFRREKWARDDDSANLGEIERKNYYDMIAHESGFVSFEIVASGHDQGGTLFTYDTVCRVRHEPLGIDRNFYIAACNYDLDPKREAMSGPTTTLRLTPLNAWSPLE